MTTSTVRRHPAMQQNAAVVPIQESSTVRPVIARSTLAIALPLDVSSCSRDDGAGNGNGATQNAAAADAEQIQAESQRLNAWFDAKYEELLQFSPIQLTFLGRKDLYDQIEDMSEAGQRKR